MVSHRILSPARLPIPPHPHTGKPAQKKRKIYHIIPYAVQSIQPKFDDKSNPCKIQVELSKIESPPCDAIGLAVLVQKSLLVQWLPQSSILRQDRSKKYGCICEDLAKRICSQGALPTTQQVVKTPQDLVRVWFNCRTQIASFVFHFYIGSTPDSSLCMAEAHFFPAPIARITVAAPVTASPPA